MDENKKFEINDDMLENVAGGAGESRYRLNEGDRIKLPFYCWRCIRCDALSPEGVIIEIIDRDLKSTYGYVRFTCCGYTQFMGMGADVKKLD